MEMKKLQTVDDLDFLLEKDERFELINGQIIKREFSRAEHGLLQGNVREELSPVKRKKGVGGWWIMTEISVQYNEHQRPCHDLAGWRKHRLPKKPTGVMTLSPDWVCEITSPNHEKKDTIQIFNILLNQKVPYYWIINPEQKTLTVYKLIENRYTTLCVYDCAEAFGKINLEPFEEVEFDLDYVFE
ncbi:MAG: Uma2 family endonuclease [Methylococcales bacterium]|jgi:Uma2 family endonuclease|nr:Uma2 family endonuclease [Methylococcales bacterium]MBT7411236.1 Uma2 family endonuclease [Methylococcales bacterium]